MLYDQICSFQMVLPNVTIIEFTYMHGTSYVGTHLTIYCFYACL